MEIKVVGEKEFCEVFEFLGIDVFCSESPQEVLKFLEKMSESECLVLLSQKIYKEIPNKVQEIKLKSKKAVILEVPSPHYREKQVFEVRKILSLISGVKL